MACIRGAETLEMLGSHEIYIRLFASTLPNFKDFSDVPKLLKLLRSKALDCASARKHIYSEHDAFWNALCKKGNADVE